MLTPQDVVPRWSRPDGAQVGRGYSYTQRFPHRKCLLLVAFKLMNGEW